MITFSYKTPQTFKMGDRVLLNVKGNVRYWIVEGYNSARTSFIFSSTFATIIANT